jgi:Ca2+-binding EF-hand superfamily protein
MTIIADVVKTIVSVLMILLVMVVGIWALGGIAIAQTDSVPKPQANVALGEGEVKKLLLLMETDSDGKLSKQAFMSFMEAEFDRLDKKKEGKLDVKELTQQPIRGFHK